MQQTAIRIGEVAFTVYPVKDMQRARKFYESVLNLTPSEAAENGVWTEYLVNGAAFCLLNLDSLEPTTSGPSVAFEVDDLDGTVQMLREQNVPILSENIESPVCHMAIVGDSEGNAIIIHKRKPGAH